MRNSQAKTKKIGYGYFHDTSQLKRSNHFFYGRVNRVLSGRQWKIDNYYEEHWNIVF